MPIAVAVQDGIWVGAYEEDSGTRGVGLSTRVFNPATLTWSKGEEIPMGEFDIASLG